MAIVVVAGEITAGHAAAVRAATAAAPHDRLTIVIESNGGPTAHAIALADAIAAHSGPTVGRAVRRCDSAAILALVACQTRSARVGTRFRLHETARLRPPEGRLTASRLRQVAGELDTVDKRFRARIAAATGSTVDELARLEAADVTLDTLAALEVGILTNVVGHSALGPAAARRREARAEARVAASRPVKWTRRDFALLSRGGMKGRPIGIGRHVLKQMLAGR